MTDRSMSEFLVELSTLRGDRDVVVATMTAGFLLPSYSESDLDLCYIAPMGSASSVGLGLALARPDLGVIVLDGDGSLLMNLGSLVTIGGQAPGRLLHIVLENGGYDMTGGQPLPGRGTRPLPEIAAALGYKRASRWTVPSDLSSAVEAIHDDEGPFLLAIPLTGGFDVADMGELTHTEQSLRTLGPPGYRRLKAALVETAAS